MHHLPEKPALMIGPGGAVWEYECEISENHIGTWFIYGPRFHPLWYAYVMFLLHLRPTASMQEELLIYVEGATHEMSLFAVAPEYKPDLTESPYKSLLHPVNFAAQFINPSDGEARRRCMVTLAEIMKLRLNPDTDAQWQWVERYGGNMLGK